MGEDREREWEKEGVRERGKRRGRGEGRGTERGRTKEEGRGYKLVVMELAYSLSIK